MHIITGVRMQVCKKKKEKNLRRYKEKKGGSDIGLQKIELLYLYYICVCLLVNMQDI